MSGRRYCKQNCACINKNSWNLCETPTLFSCYDDDIVDFLSISIGEDHIMIRLTN